MYLKLTKKFIQNSRKNLSKIYEKIYLKFAKDFNQMLHKKYLFNIDVKIFLKFSKKIYLEFTKKFYLKF